MLSLRLYLGLGYRSSRFIKTRITHHQHARSIGYVLENKKHKQFIQKNKVITNLSLHHTNFQTRTLALSAIILNQEQAFNPNLTEFEPTNALPVTDNLEPISTATTPAQESFGDYGLGGLDFYPHHWVQNFLEFIHTGLDVSWMPTIAIVTICMRLIGVPAYAKMRKFIIRSTNHQPEQLKLQIAVATAQTKQEKLKLQAEMMDLLREKDINPIKALSFQLPTMITFTSFFYALNQMVEVGLPSLTTSGMLWFQNLAAVDPFYLLPVLSCTSLFLLMKFGGATSEVGPAASNKTVMKFLQFSPFIILPFILTKPAVFFVFWLTSNSFSFIQMKVFALPSVQKYFKFPKAVVHSAAVQEEMKRMSNPIENIKRLQKEQKAAMDARKKVLQHMQKIDFSKDKTKK